MMSNKKCCVPGCLNSLDTNANLHKFPNPAKDKELFNTWVYSIGGDILQLENEQIFKYRRVCRVHFEKKYRCRNNRLSKGAVPTTNMADFFQPGPRGWGAAKRDHPDDKVSPSRLQSNPKGVRTQTTQGEQRTYARAIKDIPAWLSVAICFPPPSRDITASEATHIQTELERLLMETDPTEPLPAFRGYPRVADGALQMWCEDDKALTWLTLNAPKIRLLETDLTLTVIRKTDIPSRVRAALFVPRYSGDIARLQSILIRQNTWYDIGRWSLYKATSVDGDTHGTYLTLGVPADEVEKVLGRERRISYLLGSIYVRFYPKSLPPDVRTDTETKITELTQTDDCDFTRLEEEIARAVMSDADTDSTPGWTTQLLASSPIRDNWPRMEKGGILSDGSVSS